MRNGLNFFGISPSVGRCYLASPMATYKLTSVIFLKCLSAIHFLAFLIAYNQNDGLIGKNGLLPADRYFRLLEDHVDGDRWKGFTSFPSLNWVFPLDVLPPKTVARIGMTVSTLALLPNSLATSSPLFIMPTYLLIYILYFTINTVGQSWFSFGWESQLLETTIIGAFVDPANNGRFMNVSILACWWLSFRIMIGAGLIKIRGDSCWRDLTCMDYHYETQPVPNPLSIVLHNNPRWVHVFETAANHFVELIAPWFLFLGISLILVGEERKGRMMIICNGIIQVLFQTILILSGNLSFLNWLTILPSLCYFDDEFFGRRIDGVKKPVKRRSIMLYIRDGLFALLIGYCSVPVVKNLFFSGNGRQVMNGSFNSFQIVNTYGAFGSVTKERTELIFLGTNDKKITANTIWLEYEFKCKPGRTDRRPCIISPYHYRLDWLLWFAAFGNYQSQPWIVHLVYKLLLGQEKSPEVMQLIDFDPFEGDPENNNSGPPTFIKIDRYRYEFTNNSRDPNWWTRSFVNEYLMPLELSNDSLNQFVQVNFV